MIQTDTKRLILSRRKIFLLDFFLLLIAFYISNYIKRGSVILSADYANLLFLVYGCWFAASMIGKKFRPNEYRSYRGGIGVLLKSDIYLGYCIVLIIVFFNLSDYSRIQVASICLVLFLLETLVWSVVQGFGPAKSPGASETMDGTREIKSEKRRISYGLLTADLVLLLTSFFIINAVKRGTFALPPEYDKLLLILIALWAIVSFGTKKFSGPVNKTFFFSFWQWEKAGFLMLASTAATVYGLRLFQYSRFQGFGTICLYMVVESVLLSFYFAYRRESAQEQDIESIDHVKKILDQKPFDLNLDLEEIRGKLLAPARDKLKAGLRDASSGVYDFIEEHVDINDILCFETSVGNSSAMFDRYIDTHPVRLFLNMHKLNDFRRLNQYFLQIHGMLLPGGYFIGHAHTIQTHHQWIYNKFPRWIAHFVYLLDFSFNRILPKLPKVNTIYFGITRGKNRVISKAELLGRLCFCGFNIVASREFDKRLWVIARKVKMPSMNTNPTYGPLVALNRSGYQGAELTVYKLRTMHPYSEYLQKYVFEHEGLEKGGKLKNDFRLTSWGKVFRKMWIDELPMLYNWLKGELKIVGVRPLSSHYLSLYDKKLREMREKSIPGLIPPFYVDLPTTFDEICASEKKYLESYFKHPIKTDLSYFFKALYNIFIKKARSN